MVPSRPPPTLFNVQLSVDCAVPLGLLVGGSHPVLGNFHPFVFTNPPKGFQISAVRAAYPRKSPRPFCVVSSLPFDARSFLVP